MGIDRRNFLKMTGLTLVSLPYAGNLLAEEQLAITHATHYGAFKGLVTNGKLIGVEPYPHHRHSNILLQQMVSRLYASNRIDAPYIRKSYLDNRGNPEQRGKDSFVKVSWDTALELTAEALVRSKEKYGNESIFRTTNSTWAQAGLVNRSGSLQGRFLGYFGGFSDSVGDYSTGAAQHLLPHVLGSMEVYGLQTTRKVIEKHTEMMLIWGADPMKTNHIDNQVPDHDMDDWFYRFKKAGMRIVCIDPIRTESAEKIASSWLPIVPNTDVAMILGMCYVLLTENLYDQKFLDNYTVGFDYFRRYLLGKQDETPKTPEWAASICGISADTIRELTRAAASKRTLLAAGWACQRTQHGEQVHWSLVSLASMLGQIGLPGGGFSFNLHYCGAGSPGSDAHMPVGVPQGRNPVNTFIPTSRLGDMLLNPGKTINYNGRKITFPNVRLVYTAGVTPIGHQPDVNNVIRGFRQMDAVITHEPWWTPTARMSDIVLPTTTTMERNDIAYGGTYSRTRIWAMKQLVQPLFAAKDDFWIFQQLAKKFGFEDKFTKNRTPMEWVKWSYSRSGAQLPFDTFWKKGVVTFDVPETNKEYTRYANFREDPEAHRLRTPSGKIELYSEKVASFGYRDCLGHASWMPPQEWLGSALAKRHRYHLLSPHPRYRLHSQLDNTDLRHQYKIKGREPMRIHPQDAKQLGLNSGDLAEIFNDRGRIVVGVQITDTIRPGVIAVEEGAWYFADTETPERCLSGQVNVLTSSRPSSSLGQATTANSCLVSIRKIEDAAENLTYLPPKRD